MLDQNYNEQKWVGIILQTHNLFGYANTDFKNFDWLKKEKREDERGKLNIFLDEKTLLSIQILGVEKLLYIHLLGHFTSEWVFTHSTLYHLNKNWQQTIHYFHPSHEYTHHTDQTCKLWIHATRICNFFFLFVWGTHSTISQLKYGKLMVQS